MKMIFNDNELQEIIKNHLVEKFLINEDQILSICYQYDGNACKATYIVELKTEKGSPYVYR